MEGFIVKDVFCDFDVKCIIILFYALHISPNDHVFIGSTRIKLLSHSYMTIIYLLSWLETTGNFLVWLVYMIFCMSSVVILTSLHCCCGWWMMCSSCVWFFSFICWTLCPCCLMWPFCVSMDLGKYLFAALAVSMGHEAKKPVLIAFIYVDFVGYPGAACWYLMTYSRLGYS